mmetsp:Transcript_102685/g.267985  ORF Transcript_102685/g.267985 Transcript_102685/m.267985 type:complete len:263 (+) Transcript_102685:342-1130(+)
MDFVASAPSFAALDAPAKPSPAMSALAAGTKASSMVRLPSWAPPAFIIASNPAIRADGPPSAQPFLAELARCCDMPMNMMLRRTPLDPPIDFPVMPDRQLHSSEASARGSFSLASSTVAAALAIVEPQSASPTLPSSSSRTPLASASALHTLSITADTSASDDGLTPSIGSSLKSHFTSSGKDGTTALGHAEQTVSAVRHAENSGVSRSSDRETPFMSSEVHMSAGPTSSFTVSPHLDFISEPVRTHISCGGTFPRLLMRQA